MEVTILDGGMGGEISRRLDGAGQGLWSAKALVEAPDLVVDIHNEFIQAGAQVIITNTYSTIPHYLAKEGMADQYIELTRLGGELARRAADASDKEVRVAGALPPLNESYRPDLVPDAAKATPIYENIVKTLNPYVDLYICETMSSAIEARTAAQAARHFGNNKPVYVAWTLNETPGSGLRSGETVTTAYNALEGLSVDAYLFNCTTPEAIAASLSELTGLTDKPVGAYANRVGEVLEGWTLDNEVPTIRRTDLGEEYFADMGLKCVELGATIVGGCCGIGPEYIRVLSNRLQER